MQSGFPVGHWLLLRHSTQDCRAESQKGLPARHWVLFRHSTQRLEAVLQKGLFAEQSALAEHSTHSPVARLHLGAPPVVQAASEVQGATQLCLRGSHRGVVPEQSACERHCTQLLSSRSQNGVAPPQSAVERHCTHLLFEQRGWPVGQSALVEHSTQTLLLQLWLLLQSAVVRHSAQTRPAEQKGLFPPHWASVTQGTHRPLAVSQAGVGAAHIASAVHAGTQRFDAAQTCPCAQLPAVMHSTQLLVDRSHAGVAPEHWLSLWHAPPAS